ncbi:hypothetical protein NRB_02070 [Novosphingobium sp. 11B]
MKVIDQHQCFGADPAQRKFASARAFVEAASAKAGDPRCFPNTDGNDPRTGVAMVGALHVA